MKTLIAVVIGVIIGAGVVLFLGTDNPVATLQETEERDTQEMQEPGDALQEVGEQARQTWDATLEALQLRAEDIQEELAEDGQIIRRRARDFGKATVDAAMDTRTTGIITAKLAADQDLSVFDISVSTTGGRVTLSGTVESPELIGKATALALQTDGVREVVSNIQVE
ncbi:BON domain-containing protein [Desulfonatronum thioautotrophicum]|uniref:BON domain-containing protein n=1 Tax=Desulfonatronum thioautotrophicum TaxID=617001 RepID=UPI00069A3F00|nr:BON domain-containing protein [Desulfonatronum thioautotrophicum]